MRRRETTLDPAVAAELDALEAALADEPAAEPELAALVRDVRAQAPVMDPEFRARLDRRVEREFVSVQPRRRFALRPMLPAMGVAGCVVAVIVAVALIGGGDGSGGGSASSGAGSAGTVVDQSARAQPEASSDAAKSANGSSAAAAPPASPAPVTPGRRKVERSTQLALTTPDVQNAADGVVRATQAVGGFVQSSQVSTGDGRSTASFVLRVPTGRLDDALARLSRLGHVKSLQQQAQDITNAYDSASARLAEARAERRGLLRALARATTAEQIASLRARIADNRRALQGYQRDFDAVRNRANYATVGVELTGRPRKQAGAPADNGPWTPGDAAHDALRVLEVAAGVALIALAVLVPLALVGAAGGFAAGAVRRRRREAALSS